MMRGKNNGVGGVLARIAGTLGVIAMLGVMVPLAFAQSQEFSQLKLACKAQTIPQIRAAWDNHNTTKLTITSYEEEAICTCIARRMIADIAQGTESKSLVLDCVSETVKQ